MSQRDTIIHLIAGGVGGTAGAISTCPLEVVKTRLQSTVATFHNVYVHPTHTTQPLVEFSSFASRSSDVLIIADAELSQSSSSRPCKPPVRMSIWGCLKYIVENEGPKALFKGLGPNLVGVAPSRAIYFCTYSRAKKLFNKHFTPDTPIVHMCSAVCAGFTASTATNPIWFVKTRLQLDQRKTAGLTTQKCIYDIYKSKGLLGFYKGISASYFGISETVIHLVIYEAVKAKLLQSRNGDCNSEKTSRDFLDYMMAGAFSKTCASIIAYPHEVARTRLRQEGDVYKGFIQTLVTVFREEGTRGLYRGLATQLVRQIPNTAIMMSTYEAVVYLLSSYYVDLEQSV